MDKKFSPKAFLKERRPERFSDTTVNEALELDRSLLEYHIASLTSRSQEKDFEKFCRSLCEAEVCPNLLPQTGPTGGGDSKVDSESYPVSSQLTDGFYFGYGDEAAKERWAFAFSATKAWRPKAKSDIKKIFETNRDYKKAFFVTNQYVSDKKRANLEDELREKYKFDVRIFDLTWLLDRIFKGNNEEIAIEELGVTGLKREDITKGSLDIQRENRLDEIENRISKTVKKRVENLSVADDFIEAAVISRELERPEKEIKNRFARADKFVLNHGTPRQKVECAYQWAWTLYWWLENYSEFVEQYLIVEERVKGSDNIFDLEQLSNLWFLLKNYEIQNDETDDSISERTEALISELNRFRNNKNLPSASLHAESIYLFVSVMQKLEANQKDVEDLLCSLKDTIGKSENLIGFPLEPILKILTELGILFNSFEAYDELFETIINVSTKRDGEIKTSKLLLKRGEQCIINNKPVQAISILGKALVGLYKHETRNELVHALYLAGCSYDMIGLPWAARGTLLAAANLASKELWKYGEITPYQASCYQKLKWVELRLGRLPHLLIWHELDMIIRNELLHKGMDSDKLFHRENEFEALLGRLLLRTEFSELKHLTKMPDVLDRLGLDLSADALLYALGHNERLKKSLSNSENSVDEFAEKWRNIEADIPLPNEPKLYYTQKVTLESNVLGCKVTLTSNIGSPCIEISESILGALESFLSTSAIDRAVAREPKISINVKTSDFVNEFIKTDFEVKKGEPCIEVLCKKISFDDLTLNELQKLKNSIFEILILALSKTVIFKEFESDLETLFRDERVMDRAIAFTSTFDTQKNIIGTTPKTKLSAWLTEGFKDYEVIRTSPWKIKESPSANDNFISPKTISKGEPPKEAFDPNSISHDEIGTVSIIKDQLWDKAKWSGVSFMMTPSNEIPPVIALIFLNHEMGKKIFTQWQNDIGKIDKNEKIRMSIIKGIDKKNPYAYKVQIGANPMVFPKGKRYVTYYSRIHRMDAFSAKNIERFIEAYQKVGAYYLGPSFAPEGFDGSQPPQFDNQFLIGKRNIIIRNAYEIGTNDIDAVAITKDDDPIIPNKHKEDAPVLKLLKERNAS
ncbi:MAG: hypothetical protein ACQETE_13595 [Bacteroidota bacterium]